jgi:hypothetical protein
LSANTGLDSSLNDALHGVDSLAFHSDNDSFQPYTTIADDGWIYQHKKVGFAWPPL